MSKTDQMVTALKLLLSECDTHQVRALLFEAGYVVPTVYHKEDFLAAVEGAIQTQDANLDTHRVAMHTLGVIDSMVPQTIVKAVEFYKDHIKPPIRKST